MGQGWVSSTAPASEKRLINISCSIMNEEYKYEVCGIVKDACGDLAHVILDFMNISEPAIIPDFQWKNPSVKKKESPSFFEIIIQPKVVVFIALIAAIALF